jgi:hypothetical protein
MPFPTTTYTTATAAQAALTNLATANGLTGTLDDGQNAVQDAVLANLLEGLPGSTILGVASAANGAGALGTGGFIRSHVTREGGLIVTRLVIDLTGLASIATDLDVIGVGANPSFLTQVTTAVHGTVIGGTMSCLEVPAGGAIDIDLYVATVGTGKLDDAVTGLTGQAAVVTSGGNWTLARVLGTAPDAIANGTFLYLTSGAATAGTYTAGRILITLFGI